MLTRILIAEDDAVSRRMLETTLAKWGYDVLSFSDGAAAWQALSQQETPSLAILDWMMPEMDGTEICRRVRAESSQRPLYIILLTARGGKEDLVAGLEAGADDFITKPFDREELRARLQVGERIIALQRDLADRVRELQEALGRVKVLQALLPICSYCKKIRNDKNYWQRVEDYISEHTDTRFSHGICPECYERIVKPDVDRMIGGKKNGR
jgi:DNA-binding response OmpR family regulator